MKTISFKEYLESKIQLKEIARTHTPHNQIQYEIRKYCKVPFGETSDDKEVISMKPREKIIVEWYYADLKNPTATGVYIMDKDDIDSTEKFEPLWDSHRFRKWLIRNTHQQN